MMRAKSACQKPRSQPVSTPKQVSDYMRALQRRSADARWGGLTPEQRSAKMKALRAQAKRKPKRDAK
jgi:hypothetical protein